MSPPPVIGVFGSGAPLPGEPGYELAREIGRGVAGRGGILLCGGRGGAMEGAARGAREAGGATVGILPGGPGSRGNPYLDLVLPTGLGDARNYVNAAACDVAIALPGGAGTLSEVALALKLGRPLVCCRAWRFLIEQGFAAPYCETAAEAVELAWRRIGDQAAAYPPLPDQSAQQEAFEAFLRLRGRH